MIKLIKNHLVFCLFTTIFLSGCFTTNYSFPVKKGEKKERHVYSRFIFNPEPIKLEEFCGGHYQNMMRRRTFLDQLLGTVTLGYYYRETWVFDCAKGKGSQKGKKAKRSKKQKSKE